MWVWRKLGLLTFWKNLPRTLVRSLFWSPLQVAKCKRYFLVVKGHCLNFTRNVLENQLSTLRQTYLAERCKFHDSGHHQSCKKGCAQWNVKCIPLISGICRENMRLGSYQAYQAIKGVLHNLSTYWWKCSLIINDISLFGQANCQNF